jgi:hypothetical protein
VGGGVGQRKIAGWGVLGTVSTLSHGLLLIVSAPLWVISSGIVAGIESNAALVDHPEEPLAAFAKFARYPQGMPVETPPAPAP